MVLTARAVEAATAEPSEKPVAAIPAAICALVASLAVVSLKHPHLQNEQRIVITGNNIPAAPEETGRNPQYAEVEGQMELAAETPAAPTANAPLAGGFVLEKRALKSAAKVAS